jgi:aromatic-L-amino-acid decarboxylase
LANTQASLTSQVGSSDRNCLPRQGWPAYGDFASTGLGVLGLSWQSSPALTEVEEVVVDWVRQMTGLSDAWSGVIHDTASTCTLIALLCAREKASGYGLNRGGLQAEPRPLVVYASAHSHSSVDRARRPWKSRSRLRRR